MYLLILFFLVITDVIHVLTDPIPLVITDVIHVLTDPISLVITDVIQVLTDPISLQLNSRSKAFSIIQAISPTLRLYAGNGISS